MSELVERVEHITQCLSLTEHVVAGGSAVGLVHGEAGVGKTALLNAVTLRIPDTVRVWRGSCEDLHTANPFGALREAFHDAGPEALTAIGWGEVPQVIAAITTQLGDRRPTALIIDDVHWADEATLDVLGYLARRLSEYRLLLLMSYPDDEVRSDHPLNRVLAAAAGERIMRIRLAPFSRAAVRRLCAGSGWNAEALFEATSGNPFYVTETLAVPPDAPVPPTVSAAVSARIQRLPEQARLALERISVWPGLLEFDLAEELLGPQFPALAEAEERGILVAETDGIRFRHEIARQATAATLGGLRRRQAQREVTELLKRQGNRHLPRLVLHAQGCGDAATVVAYAPQGAQSLVRAGANRQAMALFEAVLQHEELLSDVELADNLIGYAWQLYHAHRIEEGVAQARRAVDLYQVADAPHKASIALARLSRLWYMAGVPTEAKAAAQRAVSLAAGQDRATEAFALTALGAIGTLEMDSAGTVPLLERALSLAQAADRADIVALCLNYLAQTDPGLSPRQRLDLLQRGLETASRARAYEEVARSTATLVELLYRYPELDDVQPHLTRGLQFAREHGLRSHSCNLEIYQALLHQRRGDWDAALRDLRASLEECAAPSMLHSHAFPSYARLLMRRGDPKARDLVSQAWELALRQGTLIGVGFATAAVVECAWLAGEPDEARQALALWEAHAARPTAGPLDAEIRRYARRAGLDVTGAAASPGELSGGPGAGRELDAAQQPAPEPDAAREPETAAEPETAPAPDPWSRGLTGDWRRAAQQWRHLGDPYEEALELAESDDPDATLIAWQTLVGLGARPAARQVKQRLRALGVRSLPTGPRRQTRENPGGLTDRQLDVVQLVAQGLTNAQIAERLTVSVRTVEHHVSTILHKLHMPSRRDVETISRIW